MKVIYGQDRVVAEWVCARAPHSDGGFEKFTTIGFADDSGLVAGLIYDEYRGNSMRIAMASSTPRWATRETLYALFAYPFLQLKVKRLTAYTGKSMASVRRFLERLGFVLEGTIREGFADDDCVIYGMLRNECRWIERTSREIEPERAACA